jgi:hypothetical protein
MKRVMSAMLAALTLAACGGGGGGGSSTTNLPAGASNTDGSNGGGGTGGATDVVASAGTLQAAASVPAYATGSQQLSFFNTLNTTRIAAGAGAVNQSAVIDTASQAHADYLTANLTAATAAGESPHNENPARTGYYDATPSSRLTRAGFAAASSTEVIGGTGPTLRADGCAIGLLNTVYHGAALLSQETFVGVGIGTDAAGIPLCVSDLGNASTDTYGQVPTSGAFIAYPYSGQTNLPETFYVAYESPRPSATLFPNTTAGTPVIVRVRNADFVNFQHAGTLAVTVTKFELKDAGGNVVPSAILAANGLTGSGVALNADTQLGEGFAVLVPLSPLSKGVTYTYTFTVTLKSGGTPVTLTRSFTTNL